MLKTYFRRGILGGLPFVGDSWEMCSFICVFYFWSQSSAAQPAASEESIWLPLYMSSERVKVVTHICLPCGANPNQWIQTGAALFLKQQWKDLGRANGDCCCLNFGNHLVLQGKIILSQTVNSTRGIKLLEKFWMLKNVRLNNWHLYLLNQAWRPKSLNMQLLYVMIICIKRVQRKQRIGTWSLNMTSFRYQSHNSVFYFP